MIIPAPLAGDVDRLPTLPTTLQSMARVRKILDKQPPQLLAHVALLCTSSYSYEEAAMGKPKGSDVVLMQHMEDWGYIDLCIVPVLIRHHVIWDYETLGRYHDPLQEECLQVVRASKADLQACIAGSPPATLIKHLVVIPYSAGEVVQETFTEYEKPEEYTGNETADGYEDSR